MCSRCCPTSSRRVTSEPTGGSFRRLSWAAGWLSICYWLDDDHFAFYLLDVSGPWSRLLALLSVSAMNALRLHRPFLRPIFAHRARCLPPSTTPFRPEQPERSLFTILVRRLILKPGRRIDYSGGGQPPALLFNGASAEAGCARSHRGQRPAGRCGSRPRAPIDPASPNWAHCAELCMWHSDGVYEIERIDNSMWPFTEFIEFMKIGPHDAVNDSRIGSPLFAHDRRIQGREDFR